jgi:hypothetical protein
MVKIVLWLKILVNKEHTLHFYLRDSLKLQFSWDLEFFPRKTIHGYPILISQLVFYRALSIPRFSSPSSKLDLNISSSSMAQVEAPVLALEKLLLPRGRDEESKRVIF